MVSNKTIVLIGIFPNTDHGGGPAARIKNIALALKCVWLNPVVFLTGAATSNNEWQSIPIRTFSNEDAKFPYGRLRKNASAFWKMREALRDLVKCNNVGAVIFYNQDIWYSYGIFKECRAKVPFLQQYAENHIASDYKRGWLASSFIWEQACNFVMPRLSDGSIVISTSLFASIGRIAKFPPIIVPTIAAIPAPSSIPLFTPLVIVCISSGSRRDDIPVLLASASELAAKHVNCHIHIVGLQPKPRLQFVELAKSLSLDKIVTFHGFIDKPEFEGLLQQASLMVHLRTDDPSSRACFPSRLYEVFSYGVPVILSQVGDVERYFTDNKDCIVIPPSTCGCLTEAICWVATHPAEAAILGLSGNRRANEEFAHIRHGIAIRNYLENITNAGRFSGAPSIV